MTAAHSCTKFDYQEGIENKMHVSGMGIDTSSLRGKRLPDCSLPLDCLGIDLPCGQYSLSSRKGSFEGFSAVLKGERP